MSVINIRLIPLLISFSILLAGCASSNVTRDVTNNVDTGIQNGKNLVDGATSGTMADTYQNTSQAVKGAVLGGTVGGLTGWWTSGLGILPGAATGAVIGATYGAYIDANANLEDQLENRGATIVELGDQILIVVPSDRLFDPWTANIKPQAYSTLALVTKYINGYTKMLVKISAFRNALSPKQISLALSQQQAESVSNALQANGVDARVLVAKGYGGTNLVQRDDMQAESSDNDRIEITLQKQYV